MKVTQISVKHAIAINISGYNHIKSEISIVAELNETDNPETEARKLSIMATKQLIDKTIGTAIINKIQ